MKSLLNQYTEMMQLPLDILLKKMQLSEERLSDLLKTWIDQGHLNEKNLHLEEIEKRKKIKREKEILKHRASKLKKYQQYRDNGLSLKDTAQKMRMTPERMTVFLEHETERQESRQMSPEESAKELRVSPGIYRYIRRSAKKRKEEKLKRAKKRLADNRKYAAKMLKKISHDLDTGRSDVLIFDIEASQQPDEPIEISILNCHGETVLDQLICPSGIINRRIVKLTGITNAMVANQPNIYEVMPKIRDLTAGKIMLSWGSDYDAVLMKNACSLTGIELSCHFGCAQKVHMGCIDAPAQIALGTAAGSRNQSHRALDDCKMVLKILKEDLRNYTDWQ